MDPKNGNVIEIAARTAHEMNRIYCLALGDPSQVPWDEAPDWQKESVLEGVRLIVRNPALTPEESHLAWFEHKRKEGWVYGKAKDIEHKTHPCMVPYDELPPEHRYKDTIFGNAVRGVLNAVGVI